MPEISTDMLSRELVRQLRGSQSQPAFSKALGFTSNVVYTWESGRRYPVLCQDLTHLDPAEPQCFCGVARPVFAVGHRG